MRTGYLAVTTILCAACALAQTDPGPRAGAAGAGGAYAALSAGEKAVFAQALGVFQEVDSVKGTIAEEPGAGLGPAFNGNSCAMCHAQPADGGSSPGKRSPQRPMPNPQVALATLDGARNAVPSFITADGPVREARFISISGRSSAPLDGGVHDLYTIAGRSDAPGCNLAQPDFAGQHALHNVIFRIPTPTFGLGLVEDTPDTTLAANIAADQQRKAAFGIAGRLNTSGNDGSVTRFGWKAQNKSLLIFAGEAYNVEQGVSSEAFSNERSAVPGCVFNAAPEDATHFTNEAGGTSGTAVDMAGDVVAFALFMRMSAPPTATTASASEHNGQALFGSIGCALCHTPSLTTGLSRFTGMSGVVYHPFSDFALHNMGSNLADGILQGDAGPDEFRTAPLWGVGQRLFFLHDGRAADLLDAIRQHASPGRDCVSTQTVMQFEVAGESFLPQSQKQSCGSEANAVIERFRALARSQQQDILNFLRSL